jgi:hypothetical protein
VSIPGSPTITRSPSGLPPLPLQLHESGPLGASILVGMGGFFVVLEGLFWFESGEFAPSLSFGVFGGSLVTLGFAVSVIGLLLILFAALIRAEPHHHVANGGFALVLVIVSYSIGLGGFYFGGFLAAAGAFAAIFWTPPRDRPGWRGG